jgi:hypothetical protein
MPARRVVRPSFGLRGVGAWVLASALVSLAGYPRWAEHLAKRRVIERLDKVEARASALATDEAGWDAALSLRVRRLGPLLASWETVGGCGAGGTGGAGASVKWIGRNTSGGLFQWMTQGNYIHFADGYNYIISSQITRDLGQKWNVGFSVPYLYKYYRDYLALPTDISNSGLGDVQLLVTRKLGRINSTSVTAAIGFPTGKYDATYKNDLLTQEKQLGFGRVTGTLFVDHTIDETWGVVVLGGLLSYRGDENALQSYRSPMGSLYTYAGYFMGPFVPALGISVSDFLKPDRDRTLEQDVPLTLIAGNASLEWSTDTMAILVGVSVPYSVRGTVSTVETPHPTKVTGFMPWIVAVGFSISPF